MAQSPDEIVENIRAAVASGNLPVEHLQKYELILTRAKAEAAAKGISISQCIKPLVEGDQVYVFPSWTRIDRIQFQGRIFYHDKDAKVVDPVAGFNPITIDDMPGIIRDDSSEESLSDVD